MTASGQGVHPLACVGCDPGHRDWVRDPDRRTHEPEIDPTATLWPFVTVERGLERPTSIGARTLIFAHSHVAHDALVGDDTELAIGVVLGGHCEVGDRVRIGLNATVLPFRKVGDGARVGAGAVVTRDVAAGEVWAGNPARFMRPVDDKEAEFNRNRAGGG
jgi:UDP-N-acetylglucosamine acyltransferase